MKHNLVSMLCTFLVLTLLLTPAALAAETNAVHWEFPERGVSVDLPAGLRVESRDKLLTAYGLRAETESVLFNAYSAADGRSTSIVATATPMETEGESEAPASFQSLSEQEVQELADSINAALRQGTEQLALEAWNIPEITFFEELLEESAYKPYVCATGKYLVYDLRAESGTTSVRSLGYLTVENNLAYLYLFAASGSKTQTTALARQAKTIIDSITYSTPEPTVFEDTERHWARHDIGRAVRMNLFGADELGRFKPEENATRAMLVTALYRLAGSPEVGECPYPDVKAGAWYADAATWAAESGIVKGINGTFKPDDSLTREQMAAFFQRFTEWKGHEISAYTDGFWETNEDYRDKTAISNWAKTAVAWAVENRLLTGDTGNRLLPQGFTTRAELSAVLMRYVDAEADGMFATFEK